jgi:hypothetical protein
VPFAVAILKAKSLTRSIVYKLENETANPGLGSYDRAGTGSDICTPPAYEI